MISRLLHTLLIVAAFWTITSAQLENFTLVVSAPAGVAGEYDMRLSNSFGPQSCESEISGEIVLGNAGTDTEACDNVRTTGLEVEGKIALVDRGSCTFIEKAKTAEDFGAIAIIICNNVVNDTLIGIGVSDEDLMNIEVNIPTFSMRMRDCTTLKADIDGGIQAMTVRTESGLIDPNADDEVLYSEAFTGGFNGWTVEGISCSGGAEDANATWEWRDKGDISLGAFAASGSELVSDDPCSGFIIFDSDFLDSNGDEATLGTGPCPSPQIGSITSPPISLSGTNAGDVVAVKITQAARYFRGAYFIGWSTDGGSTWTDTQVNSELEANQSSVGILRVPLTGVSSTDDVYIRFIFNGNFYFWAIDDVQIINFTGINAKISNTFYTPLSHAVPVTHADADPFLFSTDVINNGAEAIDVELKVEVTNTGSDEVVHSDSAVLNGLEPGDTTSLAVEELWLPDEIEVGSYRMDYELNVLNGEESDSLDNDESYFFQITDQKFSKFNGEVTGGYRFRTTDEEWGLGALYLTSENNAKFFAESITFGVASNETTLENHFVELALLKIDSDFSSGGILPDDFDRNENSYLNHPNLEVIWTTTHVFTGEENFDEITISLEDEGIKLDEGSFYVVMAYFDDSVTSTAGLDNKSLFLNVNSNLPGSGLYVYLPNQSPSWYTCCGNNIIQAPQLDLQISLTSPVDETPLPENAFRAFPNPAKDFINAELSFEQATNVSVVIATVEGRVVKIDELTNITKETQSIDISGLTSGAYLMRVATEEGTKTRKIMVQN